MALENVCILITTTTKIKLLFNPIRGIFSLLTRTLNKFNNEEKGQHPPPLIMLRYIVYFNGESLVTYQFNFIQLRYLLSFMAIQESLLSFPPLFYQNHFLLSASTIFTSMLSTSLIHSFTQPKPIGKFYSTLHICLFIHA